MSMIFHSNSVWPRITEIVAQANRTYAAISFLGEDAPDRLPLSQGDTLLVNAKPSNISSGATNPYAIERFLNSGVKVFSSHSLHAKVISTDTHAVIGSANASASSASSTEAIILTDEQSIRNDVRKFVQNESTKSGPIIDAELIEILKKLYDDRPKKPQTTGINSETTKFPGSLEHAYLSTWADADFTGAELAELAPYTKNKSGQRQPDQYLDILQVTSRDESFGRDDVIIWVKDGSISGPVKVESDLILLESDESRMCQLTLNSRWYGRDLKEQTVRNRCRLGADGFDKLLMKLNDNDGFIKLTASEAESLIVAWIPDYPSPNDGQ
jgi:hypothetical protein